MRLLGPLWDGHLLRPASSWGARLRVRLERGGPSLSPAHSPQPSQLLGAWRPRPAAEPAVCSEGCPGTWHAGVPTQHSFSFGPVTVCSNNASSGHRDLCRPAVPGLKTAIYDLGVHTPCPWGGVAQGKAVCVITHSCVGSHVVTSRDRHAECVRVPAGERTPVPRWGAPGTYRAQLGLSESGDPDSCPRPLPTFSGLLGA